MEVVQYIGMAHRRIITAKEWGQAGFPEGETVEWSRHNGFAVPVDQFTREQLEDVIEPDDGFVIIGGDEADVKPRRLPENVTGEQARDSRKVDLMKAVGAKPAREEPSGAPTTAS